MIEFHIKFHIKFAEMREREVSDCLRLVHQRVCSISDITHKRGSARSEEKNVNYASDQPFGLREVSFESN